jgi:succinate dehydrogenase / fumarate reductase cytochrome b subunit
MSSGGFESRPLSPFTTVWRWHVTMVMSILHRASGMALGAGSALLALWLLALASGEKEYNQVMALLVSWPGRLVLLGFTLALFLHLLNGVRHLIWDLGHGYEKETASRTAWLVMILAVLLTLALWSTGYWMFGAFPGQGNH